MLNTLLDRSIVVFDHALRTLIGSRVTIAYPANSETSAPLSESDKAKAIALMRVNHSGEVCAQALYDGQALAAADQAVRHTFEQAAREEQIHLAWTEQRLFELQGRRSLLNPLWYAGSFTLGALAGLAGDRWSLGFAVETERQVEEHLTGHLEELPAEDFRSRSIVRQMREDEARHALSAQVAGAAELPAPLRLLMRATARIMTLTAYRI